MIEDSLQLDCIYQLSSYCAVVCLFPMQNKIGTVRCLQGSDEQVNDLVNQSSQVNRFDLALTGDTVTIVQIINLTFVWLQTHHLEFLLPIHHLYIAFIEFK